MRARGALLGVLLVLGLAAPATAVDYYVRTTGSNANSGLSPANAWRTVVHAALQAGAGDTVYVGAGTYSGRIRPSNDGTSGSPVRFQADTTGAFTGDAGTVVLTSTQNPVLDVSFDQHQHWVGFTIRAGSSSAVWWQDSTGGRLEDCVIEDGSGDNVYVDDADLAIRRCIIRDGNKGVRIDDDSNVTLVNVLIHDHGNDGIDVNDESSEVTAWHITVSDSGDDAIDSYADPFVLRNSIVVFSGDDGLAERGGGDFQNSYNIIHGHGDDDYNGTSAGTGEIDQDPLFLNRAGDDYHVDPSSPAVDAGLDGSALTSVDLEGASRPQGSGWDLGAYEVGASEHFAIAHDGAAVACTVENVTITRHGPTHATDPSYTGTITVSTDTGNGDWSLVTGAGTLVNAGSGVATYTYSLADAGSVVLGFVDPIGETVDFDVVDGGGATEATGEDPALVVAGGATDDYRDDFTVASLTNQDGTLLWAGPWIETDVGSGPTTGNARVNGGDLVLEDWTNTDLDIAWEREVDLSGHTSATLLFDFRTTSGVDSNDAVFVDVSTNGGGSWTVLERITGLSGAVSGSRSYDLTPYRSVNTRVRLRVDGLNGTGGTSCCYGASNEEFRVAFLEIEVPAASTCGPDHFSISHDGSGVNCQAENVTIAAHDTGHNVDTTYTGTITLSTSTGRGDWSLVTGTGVLVNSGGGAGTYTFRGGDAGEVVLGFLDTFAETVNLDVTDGSSSEDPGEDPDLVIGTAGFSFLADGVASAIGTQIGGKPSSLAPGAQSLELEAIRTSDATGACEAALTGANPIELAFTCESPATCAGAQVTVNGSAVAANPAGSPGAWTAVSLDFGSDTDTTAPVVIAYPDVGRIQLHARYVLAPSGELLNGASNPFVVRPFALEVGAVGNPGAAGPAGPVFTAAGADFTGSVRAVLWSLADDADADGVADGHDDADPTNNANLADNAAAASFGRAGEQAALAAALLEPAGGTDPGLGGTTTVTAFAGGAGSSTAVFWDEVGLMEMSAAVADGDYLGIGAAETARIAGRSGHVGRFRPDRFDVALDTAPVLEPGCAIGSGFTWLGQHFRYATAPVALVTARSARGTQTRNYAGAWWKITNGSLANRTYTADPTHPAGLDVSDVPPTAGDPSILPLGDGTGTLTFGLGTLPGEGLRFARAGPVAPFDAEIALTFDVLDTDGVAHAANPFAFGAPSAGNGMAWSAGRSQRYGRLYLGNAVGSELARLPVPMRTESWTGAGWAVNGDDVCTVVTAASVAVTATDPPALVTAPTVGNVPFVSGDANLSFSPPGAGNDGWADVAVDLSGQTWLRWDWSGDGAGPTWDEDPSARLTFGVYAGDEPVIFRREIY